MWEKELLPGIYKARGETYCFICATEGKHYRFGKVHLHQSQNYVNINSHQFLKETALICSSDRSNVVRNHGGQVCIPALLPM